MSEVSPVPIIETSGLLKSRAPTTTASAPDCCMARTCVACECGAHRGESWRGRAKSGGREGGRQRTWSENEHESVSTTKAIQAVLVLSGGVQVVTSHPLRNSAENACVSRERCELQARGRKRPPNPNPNPFPRPLPPPPIPTPSPTPTPFPRPLPPPEPPRTIHCRR